MKVKGLKSVISETRTQRNIQTIQARTQLQERTHPRNQMNQYV